MADLNTRALLLISRSDASRSELAELSRQANPDEIDIDLDDGDESEDNEPDGKRWWLWGLIQFVSLLCIDSRVSLFHRGTIGAKECPFCCVWRP